MGGQKSAETILGATPTRDGVDFAVYSESAESIWVCLFDGVDGETDRIALARGENNVWSTSVSGLKPGARYGLRADGPYDPGQGYYFDPAKLLVDPYARRLDRGFTLGDQLCLSRDEAVDTSPFVPKGIVEPEFDPVGFSPSPERPHLIYEINVRPFSMLHPAVPKPLRGTIAALTTPEIIAHIKRIGVDVVELMPVAAWIDDLHLPRLGLTNVWGYNPVNYFALDPRLAPDPKALRDMVSTYREAGIRVVLDVVYNHTGESDINGPVLSMKGLDARTYYRHFERDGRLHLVNDAGTGNTLQCDHPAVQALVIDSLKYWVTRFGVSGFRFDLATVLGRSRDGFSAQSALLDKIRTDPVLSQCLLIAEPWDIGPGGYQVGQFGEPFMEWNDRYRDDVRRFWKGEAHAAGAFATRLAGSSDLFEHDGRMPSAGINFIAAHDGFTLADVVSFQTKHNQANGEDNRDGHDGNHSWNNGIEGKTLDDAVIAARKSDIRALLSTLFLSLGSPMLTAGDEFGRSQQGNNNAYAQDNEITWIDWANADEDMIAFVAMLSRLRADFPVLKGPFLTGKDDAGGKDVTWLRADGGEMDEADWLNPDRAVLGMFLHGRASNMSVWFNRSHERQMIKISTNCQSMQGSEILSSIAGDLQLKPNGEVFVLPRSVVILTSEKPKF